jgi:hypothetical protein
LKIKSTNSSSDVSCQLIQKSIDAVIPINQGRASTRGKTTAIACPTLVATFGATDEETFAALPGEVNKLTNRPNHLLIHPQLFTKAGGPKATRSKTLAWAIIKELSKELTAAKTDQERAKVTKEQENVGILLAFL